MLWNNGSFMFPMHSFIFCSLIILATASSSTQQFPKFQKESGLVMVDYCAVTEAVKSCSKKSNQKESYTHWSNKERCATGKYAAENCHAATARKLLSMVSLWTKVQWGDFANVTKMSYKTPPRRNRKWKKNYHCCQGVGHWCWDRLMKWYKNIFARTEAMLIQLIQLPQYLSQRF